MGRVESPGERADWHKRQLPFARAWRRLVTMTSETPALSNVTYDDLVVGERLGPFAETVTGDLAARLAGPIGEETAIALTPPAVYPVLFLRALRRAMGGIPAGSILAKQELEFHRELPVDSAVEITTWVGDKQVRRERPFVTIEFDIRDAGGTSVVTGRKVIVWPTGPADGDGA
jgi:hypothetical protein